MDKSPRLTTEQRANLVAYLDGELEESEAQSIDQVLTRSEAARHEVDTLARTWEMLDLLPAAHATDEFTERTVASVRVEESPRDISQQPWFETARQGAVLAGWIVAITLCAMAGAYATSVWIPNDAEPLSRDYEVIRNLDRYQEIESPHSADSPTADSLDFLKRLRQNRQFDEPVETFSR